MNIVEFSQVVRNRREAQRYVDRICARSKIAACPKCSDERLYPVENGRRIRCGSCRHTFNGLFGRWMNAVKISRVKWLWIVKLFELEMTSRRISEETGVSYPTVLRAVDTIRNSILARTPHGRELLAGDGVAEHVPVFSCVKSGNSVRKLDLVPRDDIIRMHRLGNGYFLQTTSNPPGNCMLCGGIRHYVADIPAVTVDGRIYLAYPKGEWAYIKERLMKFHGVREDQLPVYLNVMEYRYEKRNDILFDLLLENLCSFMPGYEHLSGDRCRSRLVTQET